ncbi:small EDRK-rich factor 2-like isoform X1 [Heptranchias perlo]|uniref:small EDRK-rich factor 2-like isoform X1 n=1 Tax=Heptranchias perlo TaxID=212740 RepID=UPI0035595CEF
MTCADLGANHWRRFQNSANGSRGLCSGNQRELARQKNAKKSTEQSKRRRKDDGLSAAARKQRDAEIMQQKQKGTTNPEAPAGAGAGTSN